ncbi:MAG: glycoside hydrolase family 32 protein [Saprospiraceae bacterium]|nr:glycoside hydrolase family 32 protein [Saprospiraceae bacterium]
MKLGRQILLFIVVFATLMSCKNTNSDTAKNEKTQQVRQTTTEQHRPLFHFSPQSGWMNDPNGMVYFKGEYHLFYQHYPDSTVWGPMHWGHAVSKDLVHWEHLPIALYPDSIGYIFSGSAVVDEKNTSGFGKNGEPPLVAIYTYHDMAGEKSGKNNFQTQGIAYSLDNGRTWTKYAQNPVIKNPNVKDFRDPKVMWYEPTKNWILALAVADHIEFYASKDLKNWEKTSEFGKTEGAHGGVWECPDLFPLKVEGSNTEKWVLIVNIGNGAPNKGSGGQYFIGTFDGKTFKNDNKPTDLLWLDYGTDNYAGVTWSNSPDNRRTLIGWMSNWQYAQVVPTTTWRSATTIPRDLTLRQTPQGVRLVQKPVKELEILRGSSQTIAASDIQDFKIIDSTSVAKEIELSFDLSKSNAKTFGVVLSNTKNEKVEIGYDAVTKQFFIDRREAGKKSFSDKFPSRQTAPRFSSDNTLKMHLYIDVASVELFADDGNPVLTTIFFPNEDFKTAKIFAQNGLSHLLKGQVWALK